jgi:hypothetical protein
VEAPFVDAEIVKVNGDTELERLQVQDIQANRLGNLNHLPFRPTKQQLGILSPPGVSCSLDTVCCAQPTELASAAPGESGIPTLKDNLRFTRIK